MADGGFDFIVEQGGYSWVRTEPRGNWRFIERRRLEPGGQVDPDVGPAAAVRRMQAAGVAAMRRVN